MLVLLYSLLSLEAFISEQLSDRRQPPEYTHLYCSHVSRAQRWAKATDLLKASTSPAQHAVTAITAACQDTGLFGLLVRTHNKLIHPRLYVEVGDRIDNDPLGRLIKDLEAPPVSLTEVRERRARAERADYRISELCRGNRTTSKVVAHVPANRCHTSPTVV
jgi:hypothetical protein